MFAGPQTASRQLLLPQPVSDVDVCLMVGGDASKAPLSVNNTVKHICSLPPFSGSSCEEQRWEQQQNASDAKFDASGKPSAATGASPMPSAGWAITKEECREDVHKALEAKTELICSFTFIPGWEHLSPEELRLTQYTARMFSPSQVTASDPSNNDATLLGVMVSVDTPQYAAVGAAYVEHQDGPADDAIMEQEFRIVPSHKAALSKSPYLSALLSGGGQSPLIGAPAPACRPRLVLSLSSPEQEQAAVAVLEALYPTRPIPELLSALTQEQQLHAAVLGDAWQVPGVTATALQLLLRTPQGPAQASAYTARVSAAVADCFCALHPLPHSLLPLLPAVAAACLERGRGAASRRALRHTLLGVMGDLEEVWANELLSKTLLALPVGALEVLLAANGLKVASEDTVLYTAQAYVDRSPAVMHSREAARKALAPLVRCPHLSPYWVSASQLCSNPHKLVLSPLTPHLKVLALMKQAYTWKATANAVRDHIKEAPASWQLPPRVGRQLSPGGVTVSWAFSVESLRAAVQRCAQQKQRVIVGTSPGSAPLGGLSCTMQLLCEWVQDGGRVNVVLRVNRATPHEGLYWQACFTVSCAPCGGVLCSNSDAAAGVGDQGWVWWDVFGVGDGAMRGGWDAQAWAAKGLPQAGAVELVLNVTSVGHSAVPR